MTYSYTYNRNRQLSDKEIQNLGESNAELEARSNVLELEDFAFSILNQLADEYNLHDDGSISKAIWDANTPKEMKPIIKQLQATLLIAMKNSIS